jgi:PAS domain S-box-containing protein
LVLQNISLPRLFARLNASISPKHAIITGVAMFAAIVLGSLLAIFILRENALADARDDIADLSTLLVEHASNSISSADVILDDIAGDLSSAGSASTALPLVPTRALHDYLSGHLHGLRALRALTIHDANGILAASTLSYPPPASNDAARKRIGAHASRGGTALFIGYPEKDIASGRWLIPLSRRIHGPGGELRGSVTAELDIAYFQAFYGLLRLDPQSTVLLLHTDGTIMAAFPHNEALLGKPATPALLARVDDVVLTQFQPTGAVAAEDVFALVSIRRLDAFPFMIAVAMSETKVYGRWAYQSRVLLVGALAAGAAALLCMLLFGQHLKREKSLDESLRETREGYQALINQSLAGVVRFRHEQGDYKSVNARFCDMTGFSMPELLSRNFYAMVHPDDLPAIRLALATPGQPPGTQQLRIQCKDGRYLHTVTGFRHISEMQTGAEEWFGLIQDMTASVERDKRMKEEEVRLSVIVQSSMDAIITIDEEENIQVFNSAAEQMFGYRSQRALRMPLSALIPAAQRSAHHAHVQRFAHSGESARKMGFNMVLKGLRADGEEFPLEASISRATSDGKVYMTVILRDLTLRVKAEAALIKARAELRELSIASQTAREEEKSRISRELHDELGQNLTALKMDLSWLESHAANDEPARNERIHAMQRVLDSTVVATRRIAADLRPLMLDDLGLMAALEWLTQDFTRRSTVPCDLSVDDRVVEVDQRVQSALYRAVQECLTNVARHAMATRVKIELKVNPANVFLRVQDDGRGIREQDRSRRGSFGLIGMRERVYILGGSVEITSEPGAGTSITVVMPRTPNSA